MNSDLEEMLSSLNQHKVRFLIIGGHAVMKYSEPRYTKDLDIWVDATPTNSKRVFKALKDFGAPIDNINENDFSKKGTIFIMGLPPSRIDILTKIPGVTFATAWKSRTFAELYGVKVPFISLNDLIKNKKASGRPQDLLDIEKLIKSK